MNIVVVFEAICDCKVGIPYEVLRLAIALKQEGHNILCLKGPRNLEEACLKKAQDNGLDIRNVSLRDAGRVRQILREFKPDLAHVFCAMIPLHFVVSRQLVRLQIPFVFEPQGSLNPQLFNMRFGGKKNGWIHKYKKKLFRWFFDSYILRHAAASRAVSEAEAGILQAHGCHRTFVVPYAVSDEWFVESTPSKGSVAEKKHFFFLGRQDIYQKGLDLLMEAFEVLNRRGYGERYDVLLAGPDLNGSLSMLQKRVEDGGLHNVHIRAGLYGEEKETAFSEADLFLCPSRFEGVPKTVREAMARGIPSLITRETNLADVCTRDRSGVVATMNGHDIASMLADYLDGKYSLASSNEIINAARKYTWERVAREMEAVYSQVKEKRIG